MVPMLYIWALIFFLPGNAQEIFIGRYETEAICEVSGKHLFQNYPQYLWRCKQELANGAHYDPYDPDGMLRQR